MPTTTSPLHHVEDSHGVSCVDVRPILSRSAENAWERTERLREQLYLLMERVCAERGLQALVLQSYPYVQPAWVKFESWIPAEEPAMTARAAATITILTRPYHRFEAIYKVEWEKHGKKGTVADLYQCGESEIRRLLTFLAAPPAPALTQRRVQRLLAPVQLRQKAYQLWKPRNTVPLVRRDWLMVGSLAAVVVGTLLLVGGLDGGPFAPDPFSSSFESTSSTFLSDPSTPMPVALDPPPVEPAPPLDTAQEGSLEETDPRLEDGRYYEMRTIRASAGEPIVVTMRSNEFDTFVVIGALKDGNFVALETNDDSGDDGSNSRLEYVPTASGEYVVLFSSYERGRTGDYTFSIR